MSVSGIGNSLTVTPPLGIIDSVKEIALSCLKEFAASFILYAAVSLFCPLPAVLALGEIILLQFSISLAIHSVKALTKSTVCDWAAAANFAGFAGTATSTLIHESGHALAASAIYTRAAARIQLIPFQSAQTFFQKGAMSAFGKMLGAANATCLIVAAGPLLSLIVSSAMLIVGLSIREKYPTVSKVLICWACLDFAIHSLYAASAGVASSFSLSHDFVHLSLFGLAPKMAAITIAALPFILLAGFRSL